MNNATNIQAAIPGLIAIAAILLSLSLPFDVANMIAFATVVAVLGIAALEYGSHIKRKLNR